MNEGQYDSKNVEHISIENIEVVSTMVTTVECKSETMYVDWK